MRNTGVVLIDWKTNEEIPYDHVWVHPEEREVSIYVGGFGDNYRDIVNVKDRSELAGWYIYWVKRI